MIVQNICLRLIGSSSSNVGPCIPQPGRFVSLRLGPANPTDGGVEVVAEEEAAHDEAHVEGAEGLAAVAGGEVEAGDGEAGHGVGVAPDGEDGVPGPAVELLPRHLPRRLRRPGVAGGRLLGDGDVGEAPLGGYAVEKAAALGREGRRREGARWLAALSSHRASLPSPLVRFGEYLWGALRGSRNGNLRY